MQRSQQTIRTTEERYEAQLPWKNDHTVLDTNYGISLGRLKSAIRTLKQNYDKTSLKRYGEILQEQLKSNIIKRVNKENYENAFHYLPHHAVITSGEATTKVRIVYDACTKSRKKQHRLK